jgi:hypothetical protein
MEPVLRSPASILLGCLLSACGARSSLPEGGAQTTAGMPDAGPACAAPGAPCATSADCCGSTCEESVCGGPPCRAGDPPVVLAAGQDTANAVALDATAVYFTRLQLSGAVMVVPKAGGAATSIAAGQAYPVGIAVDEDHVYWTTGDSGSDGSVRRAGKDGAGLVSLASGQAAPHGIAVDQGAVYWANYLAPGNVSEVAKDGSAAPVVLTSGGMGLTHVAVDEASVYFLDFYGSTLLRVAKTGGAPSLLATEAGLLGGLAIDATSVYLVAGADVVKVEKAGSTPTIVATTGGPTDVAVDADSVFFTDAQQGQVLRVAKSGGAPVVLASGQKSPSGIAVDAWCVYWANRGVSFGNDGAVMKTRK